MTVVDLSARKALRGFERLRLELKKAKLSIMTGIDSMIAAIEEYEEHATPAITEDSQYEPMWEAKDVAKFLNYEDIDTVRKMAHKGILPVVGLPSVTGSRAQIRFIPAEIRKWALAHQTAGSR